MKPHPRIRKTIKWGGAAVTVLLVVVWIGSEWFVVLGSIAYREVRIEHGSVQVGQIPEDLTALVHDEPNRFWWGSYSAPNPSFNPWWIVWRDAPRNFPRGSAPMWMCVSAVALPTLVAWRLDALARRRALLNLCPKCNYDRAGLGAGAVCPECGTPSA